MKLMKNMKIAKKKNTNMKMEKNTTTIMEHMILTFGYLQKME